MSRRLEVELTSKRDDGSYTWRQAGAKQPKGELDGSLVYEGAEVGDIVRVDADFGVDGVSIINVLAPKGARKEKQKLEIVGSGKDEGGVTTQLVGKGRGEGRGRDGGGGRSRDNKRGGRGRDGERKGGGRGDGRGGDGERKGGGRGRGDGRGRDGGGGRGRDNNRPDRNDNRANRDRGSARPKPKRLRPRRVHRDAVLNDLPEIQRPLARVVLRDGVPGVRALVEKQNVVAVKAGQLEIPPAVLEAVGENILPRLRSAEWRDNAEAALAGISEVDLRDIRKVVVAAENGAKDDESRALAQQLKDGLSARVEAEHGKWLSELNTLVKDGRTVRALRQSSRPPKAGAPLPTELATRLADAAGKSMTADTMPERWGTVLDAVAYSPVRQQVTPAGLPTKVTPELQTTVKKLGKRVPQIAALFAPPAAKAPIPAPPAKPAPVEAAEPAPLPVESAQPATAPAAAAPEAPTEASTPPEAVVAPTEASTPPEAVVAPTEASNEEE